MLTGKAMGQDALISKIPLYPTARPFEFKLLRSIIVVDVSLESPFFSYGQLYVACSLLRNTKNCFLYVPQGKEKLFYSK